MNEMISANKAALTEAENIANLKKESKRKRRNRRFAKQNIGAERHHETKTCRFAA